MVAPLAPRERHRVVREDCMDRVRGLFPQMNEFKKWNTSEDEALDLVLFHDMNPRVAKKYLRYEGNRVQN